MYSLRRNLAIFGGFVSNLAIGGSYLTSILLVYIVSYYRLKGETTLTLQIGVWISPCLAAVTGLFGYIAANLTTVLAPRWLLLLGNGTCIVAMVLASIAPTFSQFLACNLLYGLGAPITGMTTMTMLWSHFPEKKGFICGVLLSSMVLSASLSSLLVPYLVNPDNLDPDIVIKTGVITNHLYSAEVANRLPFTLRGIAVLYFLYTIVSFPFFIPLQRSESHQQLTFEENKCGTLYNGLRHRLFFCMYAIGFCSTCYGLYMSSVYKNFGQEVINDDKFFAWVNIVNTLCSASFRVICASLSDRYGFHRVFSCLIAAQLCLGYFYYFARSSPALFMLVSGLSMGCDGGFVATLVALCGQMFGRVMGVKFYSVLFTSFISSLLTSITMQSLLLEHYGYLAMFLTVVSLNWVSAGLLFIMPRECPWKSEAKEELTESLLDRDD